MNVCVTNLNYIKGIKVMLKKGFTLAEVLITLGIIGIVAAMTMPALIAKYDKKVATTRLKKFYTTYAQALIQAQNEYVETGGADILTSGSNPEQMLEWYNRYLKPYLKTAKVEKTNVGIEVGFLDGSGMLIAKDGGAAGTVNTHLLYCVNLRYCEKDEIKNNIKLHNLADRRNTFLFYTGGRGDNVPGEIYEFNEDGITSRKDKGYNRDEALRLCKQHSRNCTRLLLMDNWEFKDDYPW